MLNELYQASLVPLPSSQRDLHRWIKSAAAAPTLVIGLDGAGLPATLRYEGKDALRNGWKIEKDNHNKLPTLKCHPPIWKASADFLKELAAAEYLHVPPGTRE